MLAAILVETAAVQPDVLRAVLHLHVEAAIAVVPVEC